MTRQQSLLLAYIRDYQITNNGCTPSYREMSVALNLNSLGSIHRLLKCLKRDGHIEREVGAYREIKIVSQVAAP